ncbi:hypothetical protein [Roseateles sp. LKC17W]|uniref:DUF4189 domain-containing protein n=1 Tax=Pelomonas margarita TaxID=3299031 RepID=A0ABW7FMG9_9BURK
MRTLSLFFVLYSAASPHAQESCPSGTVCVNGKRTIQEYDPWANDPYGGFGGGGGGDGGWSSSPSIEPASAGGDGASPIAAQSDVEAAKKVLEGIDPPCPKSGESSSVYMARATNYCVGVVQDAFPMLNKTLAATACTSMNPKINLAYVGEGSCKG